MHDEARQADDEETKSEAETTDDGRTAEDLSLYYIASDEYYDDYLFNFYPYGYRY